MRRHIITYLTVLIKRKKIESSYNLRKLAWKALYVAKLSPGTIGEWEFIDIERHWDGYAVIYRLAFPDEESFIRYLEKWGLDYSTAKRLARAPYSEAAERELIDKTQKEIFVDGHEIVMWLGGTEEIE